MAKRFDSIKNDALKAVAELATGQRRTIKKGVFTQRDIDVIPYPEAKQEVQERFDEYVSATKAYGAVMERLAIAKYNLQSILDVPLAEGGLITERKLWNISGLDPVGNVLYKDDYKSYEERFNNSVSKSVNQDRAPMNKAQPDFSWADKDTPAKISLEDIQDIPGTSSEDTSEDVEEKLNTYLKEYNRKQSSETKIRYYRSIPDEHKIHFFVTKLTREQKKELVFQMNETERQFIINSGAPDDDKEIIEEVKTEVLSRISTVPAVRR